MHTPPSIAHQDRFARPVSAGWAPAYDRPSEVMAFPEQFFDFGVSLARVCPETALLYAVLEDAFLCFQKRFAVGRGSLKRQAAREAEEWFFRDESRDLFSFVSVCMALGLEPEFIRKKLKRLRQTRLDSVAKKI